MQWITFEDKESGTTLVILIKQCWNFQYQMTWIIH